MNTEVMLLLQRKTDGIGYSSDAELNAGTVLNLLGDQVSDGDAGFVQFGGRQSGKLKAVFNQPGDLADMKLGTTDGTRRVIIDLNKDTLCLVDHGRRKRAYCSQTEIAVLIHRRNRNTEGVIVVIGTDVTGAVAIVIRDIVSPAAGKCFAGTAAGKPGLTGDFTGERVVSEKGKRITVQKKLNPDPLKSTALCTPADGIHDGRCLGNGRIHADQPSAFHLSGDLVGCHFFLIVERFKICHLTTSKKIPLHGGL